MRKNYLICHYECIIYDAWRNIQKKNQKKIIFQRAQMPVNNTLICIFKLKGDSSYYQFKVEYVNLKLCRIAANC